jgi:hypothetical protein
MSVSHGAQGRHPELGDAVGAGDELRSPPRRRAGASAGGEAGAADVRDLSGTERVDGGHLGRRARPRRFSGCAAIAGDDERDDDRDDERGEQWGTAHSDLRVMALVVDAGGRAVERPGQAELLHRAATM